jgi:hypothetical protein
MRPQAAIRSPERGPADIDPTTLVATGLRATSRIAEAWGLTGVQMATLLGVSKSTYYRLLRAAAVTRSAETADDEAERILRPATEGSVRERLSLILGIYRGLHLYFSMNQASADEWIGHPNTSPVFGGQSAKEMMLAGSVSNLVRVRQYVDALLV